MSTTAKAHSASTATRAIDHLVLPVPDLGIARSRLAALGFEVAPDALHPFGTSNCCVFLADGTYLEPLAVASREQCVAAAVAGNTFVARDQAFRFRCGENGFSAVVLKSADAAADNAAYAEASLSGGPMLSFSRAFQRDDGTSVVGSFHLAFAADLRAPDFFAFSCERVNAAAFPPPPAHPNGVIGLKAIVLLEQNPSDFQYTAESLLGQRTAKAHSFGLDLDAANATVSVLTPAGARALFGVDVALSGRGLRGAGLVFWVASLGKTEACLVDRGIPFVRQASRLIVPVAEGQGAFMAFEEQEREDTL